MPRLVRLYTTQTLIGFVIAAAFTFALYHFNIAGLGHLIRNVEGGWLAAFLLFMFNGIVFSGFQFGIRITRMAEKGDGPCGGHRDPARTKVCRNKLLVFQKNSFGRKRGNRER